ncbi:DUF3772 domain-containing protein [Pseudooceanicola sp.]|uniref:DUF3772 domain-containing protein n=1 Tax=Pseudooceanicola sp. TaxID=1914328 RepID=UPI0026242F1E|nr:DUF3772 domain-containing protein [Pseudooceanicola sp.]MDF1854191.1 DUF3772 domain-containing protein [Pseudooceanicola sp.]
MARYLRLVHLLALALLLAGSFLPGAQAQAQPVAGEALDYEQWVTTAKRAEEAVDAAAASDEALETLRSELVKWREAFDAARSTNAAALETVRAQLAALGPVPEDGSAEAPEIASQRKELNSKLTELEAPRRAADVAWSRADALIRAIDRILRERQTDKLLEIGPSPLNPINWPGAVTALGDGVTRIVNEITTAWSNPVVRAEARANLPMTLLLLAVAAILLGRGRYWTEKLTQRVQGRERTAERFLLGFLSSLAQIVLPVAGMMALTAAGFSSGLPGPRSTLILQVLPGAMVAFAVARWVGTRMFPGSDVINPPLALEPQRRFEGRIHASILGLILAVYVLLREFGQAESWAPATLNTILFPLFVLAGLMLVRVSQLLRLHGLNIAKQDGEQSFRLRLINLLARGIVVLAIAGPVLAGVGYFNAGYAIVFPVIFSLQAIGVVMILQRVSTELYVLITRNRDDARDALPPVLAGFALSVLSVPVFALIWGARPTDLTELWERFRAGFTVGSARISPTDFLTFVVVFGLGFVLTRLVQGTLRSTILPKTRMDTGARNAVVSGLGYVGIFLAAIVAISSAGIDLSSLAIVAGALSVGIGFGLQNIVSNFVSGIILLIERPVSEGDWIEVGGNMGYVRAISVRSTRIETFDRRDVIVPNADLISGAVTNWTRGNLIGRLTLAVGVAYGTDTRRVETILREIAEAQPVVLLKPPPFVLFKGFGASSLDFEVRAVLRDVTQIVAVQSEMNHQIAERFAAEGIEIPFPQQDLWLRNPETLTGRQPPRPAPSPPISEPVQTSDLPPQGAGRAHLRAEDLDIAPGPLHEGEDNK